MKVDGNQSKLRRAVSMQFSPFLVKHHITSRKTCHPATIKKVLLDFRGHGIDFPKSCQAIVILREIFDALGDRTSEEMASMLTSQDAEAMTSCRPELTQASHRGIDNQSRYSRDTVCR